MHLMSVWPPIIHSHGKEDLEHYEGMGWVGGMGWDGKRWDGKRWDMI